MVSWPEGKRRKAASKGRPGGTRAESREPRAESQVQRPEPAHMDTDTHARGQATDEKPATQTGRGVAMWRGLPLTKSSGALLLDRTSSESSDRYLQSLALGQGFP